MVSSKVSQSAQMAFGMCSLLYSSLLRKSSKRMSLRFKYSSSISQEIICNCIIYASFLKCLILFYADGLKYVRKAAILRKNSFLNIAASVKAFRCYTGTGLLTAV